MIIKGSVHIGNYIYVRCLSHSEDTVGDVRLYPLSGVVLVEECTVANPAKGGGTWVITGRTHEKLHSLISPDDHETEVGNADKIVGWDGSGVPEGKETEDLPTEDLPTEDLPFRLEHKTYGLLYFEQ